MWGQPFRTLTPTLQTLTRIPAGFPKPLLNTNEPSHGQEAHIQPMSLENLGVVKCEGDILVHLDNDHQQCR